MASEVEALGGTVTSVSGSGLHAMFGGLEVHEDDPERAVRAAFRALSALAPGLVSQPLVLRLGVETGPAVVGPIGAGAKVEYGALGDVVRIAGALLSVARPGSVLVGPATRAATEGFFDWGPTEEVVLSGKATPLVATYLARPRPRAASLRARPTRLAGRDTELSNLLGAFVRLWRAEVQWS